MRGCTIRPSHGFVGIKKTTSSSSSTTAAAASGGAERAEFCARHAKEGMVDVRNKTCAHRGCDQAPTYCVEGKSRAEFCARHSEFGMVRAWPPSRVGAPRTPIAAAAGLNGSSNGSNQQAVPITAAGGVQDLPPFPASLLLLPSAAAAGGGGKSGLAGEWGVIGSVAAPPLHPGGATPEGTGTGAAAATTAGLRPDGGEGEGGGGVGGAADTDGAGDLLLALSGKAGGWR